MRELARNVSRELQPIGKIGCTVDEKAHLKKGTKSVGIARQYAGTSGKVDNCQVGVYLSLTAGEYSSLTNYRLFLPQKWIDDPVNEPGKRGRRHSLPVSDRSGIKVEQYASRLSKKDFKEVCIRRTTKGWLTAMVHVASIWVWEKKAGDLQPIRQTLIIRKPIVKTDKIKYSLSNIAAEDQSLEEFAFMQAPRFWIERCFRDNSHDLGMSDYQVRSFRGFNNHLALTCVAMEYILRERLKNSQGVPLLSTNDIRLLIAKEIQSSETYHCDNQRTEQLQKRHRQRQKDIDRYYYEFNLPK